MDTTVIWKIFHGYHESADKRQQWRMWLHMEPEKGILIQETWQQWGKMSIGLTSRDVKYSGTGSDSCKEEDHDLRQS